MTVNLLTLFGIPTLVVGVGIEAGGTGLLVLGAVMLALAVWVGEERPW
jgi:hypothetical protein